MMVKANDIKRISKTRLQ